MRSTLTWHWKPLCANFTLSSRLQRCIVDICYMQVKKFAKFHIAQHTRLGNLNYLTKYYHLYARVATFNERKETDDHDGILIAPRHSPKEDPFVNTSFVLWWVAFTLLPAPVYMCTFWSSFGRSQFSILKCGEILRCSRAPENFSAFYNSKLLQKVHIREQGGL